MPLCMAQFSYTNESWKHLVKNHEDRSIAIRKELKKIGGRLISFYYCFGEYDGICIYEAPDANKALALIMSVVSAGPVEQNKTTMIFNMKDSVQALKNASKIKFKGPRE